LKDNSTSQQVLDSSGTEQPKGIFPSTGSTGFSTGFEKLATVHHNSPRSAQKKSDLVILWRQQGNNNFNSEGPADVKAYILLLFVRVYSIGT